MPYSKINPSDMILRDHLAYDRTVLANERTFLSYMRTSIALFAAGGTLGSFSRTSGRWFISALSFYR